MHRRRFLLAVLFFCVPLPGCKTVTTDETSFHIPERSGGSYLDSRLEQLERRSKTYPKVPDYHYEMAAIHYRQENFRESAAALRHAISLDPDESRYYYHLGRIYLNMRELEKAEETFRKAMRFTPEERYSGPRAALAYVLALRKKVPEAIRHFEKCLEVDPENVEFHYFLGALHDIAGNDTQAIRYFTEYLDRDGRRYRKKAAEVLGHLGIVVELEPLESEEPAPRGENELPPGIDEGVPLFPGGE